MIRPGIDRDNFTYLPRLWDPIDSRRFYRITKALNRFEFLFGCIRFDNCRNRPCRQENFRLAVTREVWSIINEGYRKLVKA